MPELRYNSDKHNKIRDALVARKNYWEQGRKDLVEQWNDDDDIWQAYIALDEDDRLRREARKNDGVVDYVTIAIPYSVALTLTAHTYWSNVFMQRSPIHQFIGMSGQPETNAQAVESVLEYQTVNGGHTVPYYQWLMDPGRYGVGIVGTYWDEEQITTTEIVEEPVTFLGVPLPDKTRKVKRTAQTRGYVGNRVFRVSPYDFIWDVRYAMRDFQDGEFAGRRFRISTHELIQGREDGRYFNIKAAKEAQGIRQQDGSPNITYPQEHDWHVTNDITDLQEKDGFEMTVRLIPREWGLGPGDRLEMWTFSVVADKVIIEAEPQGALHGKFQYGVMEYEIDGQSIAGPSILRRAETLNKTIEWLVNSHFFNVRAALNNIIVYDPNKIVSADLKDGGPGMRIRMKNSFTAGDVNTAIKQLPVTDVTRGHLADIQFIGQMMQRLLGVNDPVMGFPSGAPSSRQTATQVRTEAGSSLSRLKTNAEYFSAMGWGPFASILLANTQQYLDGDLKVRLAGDHLNVEDPYINVDAESIAGMYQYIPVDGTLPFDRQAHSQILRQMMQDMMAIPGVGQGYNLFKLNEYIWQQAGVRNIRQFRIQVVDDQTAMQLQQQGDLIGTRGGSAGGNNVGTTPEGGGGAPPQEGVGGP